MCVCALCNFFLKKPLQPTSSHIHQTHVTSIFFKEASRTLRHPGLWLVQILFNSYFNHLTATATTFFFRFTLVDYYNLSGRACRFGLQHNLAGNMIRSERNEPLEVRGPSNVHSAQIVYVRCICNKLVHLEKRNIESDYYTLLFTILSVKTWKGKGTYIEDRLLY